MTKYIITTGGVLSGLGKGVTNASIGNLLKAQGHSVFVVKFDPYLNIDPGVMSPIEHGEVYVTSDGGETDLDLGHYERFIDVELTKESNFTSGKIYSKIFEKERQGIYGGKTVQIVPHVVDEINNILLSLAKKYKTDFILIEIGGTVGDIESSPYIYAMSKFKMMNPKQTFFAHLSFVPFLNSSGEYKSKPSQASIATLRSFGINPNLLLLRSQGPVNNSIIKKMAESAFLKEEAVINIPDIANIYQIPLFLHEQHILKLIYSHFGIKKPINNEANNQWANYVSKVMEPKKSHTNLLLVGKYTALEDAYLSIVSSLKISATHQNTELKYTMMDADAINQSNVDEIVKQYDGVVILPGFGYRAFEQKVFIANYTRDKKIPTLGICLGFQAMTIAHARKKGILNATSKEFENNKQKQTFILKPFYENGDKMPIGGTLRLGSDSVQAKPNSLAAKIYGNDIFNARHRHRYEVAVEYREKLQDDEFSFSGRHPETDNAEICELKNHPFYVGVQYHPEFSTRVLSSNPLFDEFIKSTKKIKRS